MSTLVTEMDRDSRQYLVFGYVRLHSNSSIPCVITKLLHSFYDEIFSWIINPNQIQSFINQPINCNNISSKTNKTQTEHNRLYGKPFTFKNIEFKCFLEPRLISFEKYIGFFVAFDFTENTEYESLTIYYELYCKQMDITWKNMARLKPHRNNCGWPMDALKLSVLSKSFSKLPPPLPLTYYKSSELYQNTDNMNTTNNDNLMEIDHIHSNTMDKVDKVDLDNKYTNDNNGCVQKNGCLLHDDTDINMDGFNETSDELAFECYVEVLHTKLVKTDYNMNITNDIGNLDDAEMISTNLDSNKSVNQMDIDDKDDDYNQQDEVAKEQDEICISDREEYVWILDENNVNHNTPHANLKENGNINEVAMYIQSQQRNLKMKNSVDINIINDCAVEHVTDKRFYSRNFGSFDSRNWCLECVINGTNLDISLYLRLLGLPENIERIKVSFNLYAQIGYTPNIIKYKIDREYTQYFDVNNNSWGWSNGVLSLKSANFSNDSQLKVLSFGVELTILEIYSSDATEATPIPPDKWLDFGVLSSLSNIFADA